VVKLVSISQLVKPDDQVFASSDQYRLCPPSQGRELLFGQVRRLLVVIQNRDAQYKHGVRKKESELARLKERLHSLLVDGKTETKLGKYF